MPLTRAFKTVMHGVPAEGRLMRCLVDHRQRKTVLLLLVCCASHFQLFMPLPIHMQAGSK
jgi:hypothetical protein